MTLFPNYPAGVSDADFDDEASLRREYREYVLDCRAEGDMPLPYQVWLANMEGENESDN